jgi:hypothetical protein
MTGGKFRHCMKLGFSRLAKTFGVDDEAMLAIEIAAHYLEEQYFERIEKFAVLGQGKTGILAMKIDYTALIGPLRRDLEPKTNVANDLRQKFFCSVTRFVHIRLRSTELRFSFHLFGVRGNSVNDLGCRRLILFVQFIDQHLLAEADNVTEQPVQ